MPQKTEINLKSQSEIKKILIGAATVIQSAFRMYKVKKQYQQLLEKKINFSCAFNNKLFLGFLYDCLKNCYLIDCLVV